MSTNEALRLITTRDAAKLLGISHVTLYRLVRANVIPVVRLGRSCRFSVRALQQFVEAGGRLDATSRQGGHHA